MEISSNLRVGGQSVPTHRTPATPPVERGPDRSTVNGAQPERTRPSAISKPVSDEPLARPRGGDVRREVANIAKQVRDLARDVERPTPERVRDQRAADRVRDLPLPASNQTEPNPVVKDTPLPESAVKDTPQEGGINGYSAAELRDFADQALEILKYIHSVLKPAPERIENPVAASASFTQATPNAVEGTPAPSAPRAPQAPTANTATPSQSEFQEFASSTLSSLNEIKNVVTNLPRPSASPQPNAGGRQPLVLTLGKQESISQISSQSTGTTADKVGPRLQQLGENIVSLLTLIKEQVSPTPQSVGGSQATTASIKQASGVNLIA